MTKSTHSVRAERINTALGLIQKHSQLSEAATDRVRHYGISKRQAYRYLEMAKQLTEPIVIPDQKTQKPGQIYFYYVYQKLNNHQLKLVGSYNGLKSGYGS